MSIMVRRQESTADSCRCWPPPLCALSDGCHRLKQTFVQRAVRLLQLRFDKIIRQSRSSSSIKREPGLTTCPKQLACAIEREANASTGSPKQTGKFLKQQQKRHDKLPGRGAWQSETDRTAKCGAYFFLSPMRLSLPANKFAIFLRWRYSSSTLIATTANKIGPVSPNSKA